MINLIAGMNFLALLLGACNILYIMQTPQILQMLKLDEQQFLGEASCALSQVCMSTKFNGRSTEPFFSMS